MTDKMPKLTVVQRKSLWLCPIRKRRKRRRRNFPTNTCRLRAQNLSFFLCYNRAEVFFFLINYTLFTILRYNVINCTLFAIMHSEKYVVLLSQPSKVVRKRAARAGKRVGSSFENQKP